MSKTYWRRARDLSDLDDAQRLRFHCISEELGIQVESACCVERDVSSIDCLSTTEHVLVYEGRHCIATARVVFPNPEVARTGGTRLGLELEHAGVDLAALHELSPQLAEISGLFVLRQWHGTAAAARLYEGLYVLTRQRGARYWVGGVDCRTSNPKEAALMHAILASRGRVNNRYPLTIASDVPGDSGHRGTPSTTSFYTPEQLDLAGQGRLEELPIASALGAFTKRLGASCIGRPALHPRFPRYVLPMLVDLERLPPATLRMFDQAQLAPLETTAVAGAVHLAGARRIAS